MNMLQLLTSFVLVCVALIWLLNMRQRKAKLTLETAGAPAPKLTRAEKKAEKQAGKLAKNAAADDAEMAEDAAPFMRRRQIGPRAAEPAADTAANTGPSDVDTTDSETLDNNARNQSAPDHFPESADSDDWSDSEPEDEGQSACKITPDAADQTTGDTHGDLTAVEEPVSVVLRRTVIPDAWGANTSWLGGLPMMPESAEWPRALSAEDPALGEVPLHFLAQISCADLPADLWGGLGPREGWLLFFVNPNVGAPDEQGSHLVMYTSELGPERPAPGDLGPVHDKVYTGGSYNWLPLENVPQIWRKWPVEALPMPNVLHDAGGYQSATPKDFASMLYDGAPVADTLSGTVTAPYTYGQSAAALRQLAKRMGQEPREVASTEALNMIVGPRALNQLLESLQHERARLDTEQDEELRARRLADLLPRLALVTEAQTAGELVEMLNRERSKLRQWRSGIAKHCVNLERLLSGEADDTPLPLENWEELQNCFIGETASIFELRIDHNHPDGKGLKLVTYTETADLVPADGLDHLAVLDCLDEERCVLVPDAVKQALAPPLRALYANRPHRMGGYHDGVQSSVTERVSNEILLLQLATDDAMDWCWGDAGAYYFWIDADDLKKGDFSKVSVLLECC